MPFRIIRGDITEITADAIVNAANPNPVIGAGVDAGIHQKAGPRLLAARKRVGAIAVGQAALTPAFGANAKYIIHAVGPVWKGGEHGEADRLRQCYDSALRLAAKKRCASVAFPLLSAGNDGFPKAVALQIAVNAVSAFLLDHDMYITLVVFEKDAFLLSEKLFQSVQSYIDEHYIRQKLRDEYAAANADTNSVIWARRQDLLAPTAPMPQPAQTMPAPQPLEDAQAAPPSLPAQPAQTAEVARPADGSPCLPRPSRPAQAGAPAMPMAARPTAQSLQQLLQKTDAGFSETLLKLIDRTGKKDAEIYKRANIDRKLFSKIRSNPAYRPSKSTALAFAVALELSLDETRDLIGRAGYALSHSSKFDIIVEYFILHKNYDVMELNETLFTFDQPLLGG